MNYSGIDVWACHSHCPYVFANTFAQRPNPRFQPQTLLHSIQSSVTEAEKKEIVAPSKLKSETLEQLNSIVKYLNIRLRYHKATYGALAAEIAELINGLNTKIAIRSKGVQMPTTKPKTQNPIPWVDLRLYV